MAGVPKAKKNARLGRAATGARYVALFRAVNVGGNGMLAMADLRSVLAGLGYSDVVTILQSGNAVFGAREQSAALVGKAIETTIAERLGVSPDVMVRSATEWEMIVERNPFPHEAKVDPSR